MMSLGRLILSFCHATYRQLRNRDKQSVSAFWNLHCCYIFMGCRLTRSVDVDDASSAAPSAMSVRSHRGHRDRVAAHMHCNRHFSCDDSDSSSRLRESLLQRYAAPPSKVTPPSHDGRCTTTRNRASPAALNLKVPPSSGSDEQRPLLETILAAAASGGPDLVLLMHALTAGAAITHASPSAAHILGWQPSEITGRPASFWYAASSFSRLRDAEQNWNGCTAELQGLLQSFEHWQMTEMSGVRIGDGASGAPDLRGVLDPRADHRDLDHGDGAHSGTSSPSLCPSCHALSRAQDMLTCLWSDASTVCERHGYRLLRLIPRPTFPHRKPTDSEAYLDSLPEASRQQPAIVRQSEVDHPGPPSGCRVQYPMSQAGSKAPKVRGADSRQPEARAQLDSLWSLRA